MLLEIRRLVAPIEQQRADLYDLHANLVLIEDGMTSRLEKVLPANLQKLDRYYLRLIAFLENSTRSKFGQDHDSEMLNPEPVSA